MRKYILSILATLIIGLTGALTAPAHAAETADTCATRHEFGLVKMHMSPAKVRQIFGYRGDRQGIDDDRFALLFFACSGPKAALIMFKKEGGTYKKMWVTVR